MKIYLAYDPVTRESRGFHLDDIHEKIPESSVRVDEGLWRYLQSLTGTIKFLGEFDVSKVHTLEDRHLFGDVPIESSPVQPPRIEIVEEQNSQLVFELAMKDTELKSLKTQYSELVEDSTKKDLDIEQLNQTVSELVLAVAKGGM